MTPHAPTPADRWAAVTAVFAQAVPLDPAGRAALLQTRCADAGLRADVEALLEAHDGDGPLDALADAVMSPLLVRTPPPPAPLLPATPERYRILESLGGGGMGVVYRARDERLERDVALKFLPPHLGADAAARRRFLVEARAAAALEHPNICTVHEIGDAPDGQLYIVMACYEGETLARRLERGPLPVAEALRIAADVARGLAKAHERGIVHRDIKPANVFVTRDGLVKILDFGIAKLVDAHGTQTVGVVGTLAYMSPEQAFGEAVDHRADIWSLGVVLFEMLTGRRPFRGASDHAMLAAAVSTDLPAASSLHEQVPVEADVILHRALAKQPTDRFASAADFAAALAACPAVRSGAPARTEATIARGGERRQVAVVHAALAGLDAIVERLSPDEADRVVQRLHEAAADVAAFHGGLLNTATADGAILLFGVPTAHEDDALRAVRAAFALRERVTALVDRLDPRLVAVVHLGVGVHTGVVVAQPPRDGDRGFRVTGAPADVAARRAAAAGDALLVSAECRRLVARSVVTEEVASITMAPGQGPVVAHRVTGTQDSARTAEGEFATLTPFVGRAREQAAITAQLDAALGGSGRVVILVGEAGAGKSRLLQELRRLTAEAGARVLLGRCDAYGSTTPFRPFVEAAQTALGIPRDGTPAEREAAVESATAALHPALAEFVPLLLALLSIPSERHPVPERLRGDRLQTAMLEAVAALFTLGAHARPAVLLLEDWHWADEASRAAFRQLAEIVPSHALLLVVTSRPDSAIEWGSAEHQMLLPLAPLDQAATAAIARAAFGAERVAPELLAWLHERTGGNPFFLEEVCAALREDGTVTVEHGEAEARTGHETLHVPETVQGVLRTRLDRLDAEAREVLRIAAVIGRDFTRGVLEDVAERRHDVARPLERLKSSGLVQQAAVVPEARYRFKHALTQEVAYDSLLDYQRVALHLAVGRAIEQRYAAQLDEHVDRLAQHFSLAEAWAEAVRFGLRAAERAAELSLNAEALAATERVEEWLLRLPDDAARRDQYADLLLRQERLCEMLGLRHRQLAIVDALITLLTPAGPSLRLAQVHLRQGDAFTLLRRFAEAEAALRQAHDLSRTLDCEGGVRNALRSLAFLRSHENRHEEALALIEEVLALGRAAGDQRAAHGDLATQANLLRALGRTEEALDVLNEALAGTTAAENPLRYGALLNVLGTVHRDLGQLESALDAYRRTEGLLSLPIYASFTLPSIAQLQLQQGDVDQALATYRDALEVNRRARYADGTANVCRSLGEVLLGLERFDDALPYLREAAARFAQLEDPANETLMWRRIALAEERRQAPAAAQEAWARAAALLRGTDALGELAEVLEGQARAMRRTGADAVAVVALYEDALAHAEAAGDWPRALAVRNTLGILHWEHGVHSKALRHYDAALLLCRALGDRVHEALVLNSLGVTLHRLGRWEDARSALSEGVRVAEEAGAGQLRAQGLAALAEVDLAAGWLDEAQVAVEASLALRRAMGDRSGEGWMLERLARVHLAQGSPDAARAAARAAQDVASATQDPELQAAVAALGATDGALHSHTS